MPSLLFPTTGFDWAVRHKSPDCLRSRTRKSLAMRFTYQIVLVLAAVIGIFLGLGSFTTLIQSEE